MESRAVTLPTTFRVGALAHPRLRLRQPVDLDVEQWPDYVLVTLHPTGDWGIGPHLTAAVEDWQQTMVELYATLEECQDRLGPAMAKLWEQVQTMIEVRS